LTRGTDAVPNHGGAHDLAVEDDGKEITNVLAGEVREAPTTPSVQLEVHQRLVVLGVSIGNGVLQELSRDERVIFQDIKPTIDLRPSPHQVGAPLESDPVGHGHADLLQSKELRGHLHVGLGNQVDPLSVPLSQERREGTKLGGWCLDLCGVGPGRLFLARLGGIGYRRVCNRRIPRRRITSRVGRLEEELFQ
jgi:hypothetical protein